MDDESLGINKGAIKETGFRSESSGFDSTWQYVPYRNCCDFSAKGIFFSMKNKSGILSFLLPKEFGQNKHVFLD